MNMAAKVFLTPIKKCSHRMCSSCPLCYGPLSDRKALCKAHVHANNHWNMPTLFLQRQICNCSDNGQQHNNNNSCSSLEYA